MQLSGRAPGEASGRTYDVFISHAGPQKANFAVWLQRELRRHGVSAFLDDTSLRNCDAADAEIEATFRSSSMVVFVLTPDFVRSSYCLKELHWALHPSQLQQQRPAVAASDLQATAGSAAQQQAELHQASQQASSQPLLLPVFYHTSDIDALQQDVELQMAEARNGGAPPAALQRLQQIGADLADRVIGDRLDSHRKLDSFHVDAVVAEVLHRLKRPPSQAPTYAVGMESRVQELLPLLQPDQPGGVRVLSLHGTGGIGKTTLARELFNRLSGSGLYFSSRLFLEVKQDTPLLYKQQQLIQVLGGSCLPAAGSVAQQQQQLERCIQHAGALLLVLDDIWTLPQRDALLSLDALAEGSRIILTGRDSSNLHPDGGRCLLRPVKVLAHDEAEQLLCQHAFAADQAPPGYHAAIRQALAVCGGLPLALQVVGAGMRSCSPETADDAVKDLLAVPDISNTFTVGPSNVLAVLQWSLDRLPTDEHRHLFLDAALLMRGHPQEDLVLVWAGILQQQNDKGPGQASTLAHWRRKAEELWTTCVSAALVSCRASESMAWQDGIFTDVSRVQVHDCMVEMARAVSRRLSRPASWPLSSLSPTSRLPQVGSLKTQASRLHRGPPAAADVPAWTISELLDRHQQSTAADGGRLAAVDLPLRSQGRLPGMRWFSSSDEGHMPLELLFLCLRDDHNQWAVLNQQLLVLDAPGDNTCGHGLLDSVAACSKLRYLSEWSDHRLRSLPNSIGSLRHLEVLQLTRRHKLVQLLLRHRLLQLPVSIARLQFLQLLDLAGCRTLQRLPDSSGSLAMLQTLTIRRCEALQRLPDSVGSLASLMTLDVRNCRRLRQLPDSIGSLGSLVMLDLKGCKALQHLPHSIGSLANLTALDVSGCTALRRLPDSIGSLGSLTALDVSGCVLLQQLPDSIGRLCNLVTLMAASVLRCSSCRTAFAAFPV